MFRHPKYYTELRKRNREVLRSGRGLAVNQAPHVSDQAISLKAHDGECERAPDPGLKLGEMDIASSKHQATSDKPQASSYKQQASSNKLQASGQASSNKR